MLVKLAVTFVPTVVIAVTAARAIRATINVYSTNPPPCSSLQNIDNNFIFLSLQLFTLIILKGKS
jgi:hypothetical protein